MYWIRSSNPFELIPWVILFILCWTGGWLIATHLFALRPRERLVSGLGIGLLSYIVLSNLLAHFLSFSIASWCASLLILGLGILFAWRSSNKPWFSKIDLQSWPQVLFILGITILFTLINRGLAIFDEFYNLPLISMLAAGDVPPHYHLNPGQPLAYHYGLLLMAANLVKFGNFFVWSAFDLSRAFIIALTLALAWQWFARFTNRKLAIFLGVLLVLFGMGARWLLLFMPQTWMNQLSASVNLFGSGASSGYNLQSALGNPWKIEGGGPFAFPFAFINGIFLPLNFALGGSGALSEMTLLLLLLLARRKWKPFTGLTFSLLLSSLALSGEHYFVLIWGGITLAIVIGGWMRRSWQEIAVWSWVLLPALVLALLGGGVITQIFLGLFSHVSRVASPGNIGLSSFSLRWPPVIFSAHLGALSLTQPLQLLAALAEIGLVFLLAPSVSIRAWKKVKRGDWIYAGIGLAALVGFILPIFIRLEGDRNITRISGAALFIWLILGFPIAWHQLFPTTTRKANPIAQALAATVYAITVFGGITLFAIQMIAVVKPQYTYFANEADAKMSRTYWNRLQPNAQVLDTIPYRAITLFGRAGGKAYRDTFEPFPDYSALKQDLNPATLANAGYAYFYMDKETWQSLNPDQKQAFQDACVQRLAEQTTPDKDFRWLLDIQACKSDDHSPPAG